MGMAFYFGITNVILTTLTQEYDPLEDIVDYIFVGSVIELSAISLLDNIG